MVDVKWIREGDALVAAALGRIDSSSASDFQQILEGGIAPDDHALVLDAERVSFLSSAGLRVLLVVARRFKGADRHFLVCSPSESTRQVLEASGFDRMIPVHESRAAALASITES